jgi:anthranilate phosphoribosyltransferase
MVDLLKSIIDGESIEASRAEFMMSQIISGQVKAELVGALLASLNFRQPDGKTLAGFVRAFRQKAILVPVDSSLFPDLTDVCGTGGDGHGTFNVSTCVAFLAAACHLPIAKHGNRAVSSRCGSFDVLEELGVPFADTPSEAIDSLRRHRLTFMYAPSFHPAFRELSKIRRTLKIRTVFNALGPLLNPTNVRRQLIGVYSLDLVTPVAEALAELGAKEALVVCGEDGSDEISLCSPTRMAHLQDGKISISRCQPEDFGFSTSHRSALLGGTAKENAEIISSILKNQRGPKRDMVIMNTSAALLVGGKVDSLKEGALLAASALNSGRAFALLDDMRESLALGAAQ